MLVGPGVSASSRSALWLTGVSSTLGPFPTMNRTTWHSVARRPIRGRGTRQILTYLKGSYDSRQAGFRVNAGLPQRLAGFTITPNTFVQYTWLGRDGYTE